jgi:hypothetical protein
LIDEIENQQKVYKKNKEKIKNQKNKDQIEKIIYVKLELKD